ncbi:CBL-interacting serine/threonine-protein kinase 16 [Parachaetomium inaequale]|uniref:EKC/KEOPS complex subunit BUD32 n=1 Tax=Parachaetomium inaequale TaxID=2588326 RepID=A0AAN6P9P5_9PEZI|nr:CBL-interacting serine/threonine-protein kinase 16 [Parachaetomium inaequale]
MGYFEEYDLDSRFKSIFSGWNPDNGHYHVVIDWDQRRTISVSTLEEKDEEFVFEALEELIDDLPENVVRIAVSNDFKLLSSSTDVRDDRTAIPFYPSLTDFPPQLPKVRRSQLSEIERLGVHADHTTYEPTPRETKHVVFKYYTNEGNVAMFWHEINCTLRIPHHPNIVPFDRLVVDSATAGGAEMVVGFTTPFIAGGTVSDNVSRVFTLEHLEQLTAAIDYLNLHLGLIHGDISTWNLLIDPSTDRLKIFDFNLGAKLGCSGDQNQDYRGTFAYDKHRNDVKLAVFTLYEIITRDLSFREENHPHELDAAVVLQMEEWERHPDVRLEEGVAVAEYRRVLAEWVNARRERDAEIQHYKQAPDFIDWPSLPEFPLVEWAGSMMRRPSQMRKDMIRRGEPFFKWQRPSTRHLPLPEEQRLLATGEILG